MRIFAANINFINNFKTLQQMKTKIKNLLCAAIMMVLPLSFTSCDDILGSWERPVPQQVKMALTAALVNGAEVSVSFQINGVSYTAEFTKDGNFFINGGTPPTGYDYEFYEEAGILHFGLKDGASKNCLVITFNTSDNTYAVYAVPGFSFDVEKFKINNTNLTITNAYPKTVKIYYYDTSGSPASEKELVINYKDNETWEDVIARYGSASVEVLTVAGDFFKVVVPALPYNGQTVGYGDNNPTNQVPISHKVGIKDDATYEGKYVCYEAAGLLAG